MSDGELGIAVVGGGVIGKTHADAIAATAGARVVATVDEIPAAAEGLADRVAAATGDRPAVFRSLTDALASDGIDLVAVATPSGLHTALAAEALDAHRHLVIEKPIDVSVAAARGLVDRAERSDRTVSVISQHRFDPGSVTIAEAARSGRLGRLTSAVASVPWWRSQAYYDSGAWRGTWALDGGGAAMNQGVHTVDLLVWFLGEPVEISARTARLAHERIEVEDVAVAWIAFASGALAVLHCTTASNPGRGVRVAVHGDAGDAVLEDDELLSLVTAAGGEEAAAPAARTATASGDPALGMATGHARQYADVVQAIRTGRPPAIGARDALRTLAVVRSIYLSARRGSTIRIADVLSGAIDDAGIGS